MAVSINKRIEEEGASFREDVASSVENTEVLMVSYIEDNTSQGKN